MIPVYILVMSNQVIHGDCYEILKTLQDKSIDLVLIDPPYQISRKSNFTKNSNNTKYNKIKIDFGYWDQDEINLDDLFKEFKRVLKPCGYLIIFYDVWKGQSLKFYSEKWGFKQPRICQWVKTNPVPINSKKNYLSNSIEFFFTFVKGKNPTFNSEYDKGIYNYPICHGKERTSHPTQKPLSLIKELLEKHTNKGDVVLDCFAGSGTTGIACAQTDRNYILIEKELEYYNLITQRLES
jgi:site-specific DNA-methyltransferase (adenine-specific)